MSRRFGRSCLLSVLLGLPFLVGCGRVAGETRLPAGTPIVLVSIDTLRSDRLPAYGYGGVETPAIDRLREDSILFEHAYCPAPLTLPSYVSLLTGLLPPEHGVRSNMGYRLHADEVPYLPRALKQLGYHTGAAVSSFVLRGASGLASDFDFYEDRIAFSEWAHLGDSQRPGSATLRATVDWLRQVQREPFFLFFHLYEPHAPYEPPEPFASRYASPYDGEVAAADAVVGELLDELERLALYDRSLIVLLSDHGEGLRDHGDLEHGPLLYREVLQVPLLLKLPGSERGGSSVAAPAQLIDLFPTLLALLGTRPEAELSGTSLLALADDQAPSRPIYSETFFPRLHFGWSELASLIEYPYHLIEGPDPELYDLERDPKEIRNLVVGQRRLYARLKQALAVHDHVFRPPADQRQLLWPVGDNYSGRS
ncbi:MAG: sulfatase [Thermoanaerobaculia bacterium]